MREATKDRIFVLRQGWRWWPLFMAVLFLQSFISVAAGQNIGQGASPGGASQGSPSAGTAAGGPGQDQGGGFRPSGPGSLSGALPGIFKGRLIKRFSVGQVYESGILNSNRFNASDNRTDASASFLYDVQRKHSEYTFDYQGTARHYHRFSGLDVISHDVGLGQVVRWSPRLTTSFLYRYSSTPDLSQDLPQESVSRELSLMTPAAVSPPLAIPAEQGLARLRSARMTNHAQVGLSYQRSLYTSFSIQGDFQRQRYQDKNLFGSEHANISAQANRILSPRTVVGLIYDGSWFHQPGGLDRTIVHSGNLSLSRELTPHLTVSVSGGRTWSHSDGQAVIPLSPVLSDLLGTRTLIRRSSRFFSAWTRSANLLSHWQWKKVDFGFTYARSISNNNLLGRPAATESFTLSLGRLLGRSTIVSSSIVYGQSEFFSLQDSRRLDQGVLTATFTRPFIAGLDFSMFFNYSKIIKGAEGSFLFPHIQGGIRFVYHLPRVRPS